MSPGTLAFQPYRLELARPLTTAHGRMTHRTGWWVRWSEEEVHGFGEIAPLPSFGTETVDDVAARLPALAGARRELSALADPASWELGLSGMPALRSGVEQALRDVQSRCAHRSLARSLGPVLRDRVPLTRLVAHPEPTGAVAEARSAVAAGFGTLKIKVGAGDPQQDLARVRAVRAAVGMGVKLRADANGAWSFEQARELLAALAPLELDLLEEPCRDLEPEAWLELGLLGVPLAADESVSDPARARALLARRAVAALVLKPTVLGGLGMALALAHEAQAQGLRVVVTSSLEGAIGVLGAVALAATLSDAQEAHGLATLEGFTDPAQAAMLPIVRGHALVPEGPGLGAEAPWAS